MIGVRELLLGFQSLPLKGQAVIAHGSFKSLGEVQGGPKAVIDALVNACGSLVMPTFTYGTMVTPLVGPPNNALDYAAEETHRKHASAGTLDAVPFRRDLPADEEMGILAETLRRHAAAKRSFTRSCPSRASTRTLPSSVRRFTIHSLPSARWLKRTAGWF